jgi:hypothetical protein
MGTPAEHDQSLVPDPDNKPLVIMERINGPGTVDVCLCPGKPFLKRGGPLDFTGSEQEAGCKKLGGPGFPENRPGIIKGGFIKTGDSGGPADRGDVHSSFKKSFGMYRDRDVPVKSFQELCEPPEMVEMAMGEDDSFDGIQVSLQKSCVMKEACRGYPGIHEHGVLLGSAADRDKAREAMFGKRCLGRRDHEPSDILRSLHHQDVGVVICKNGDFHTVSNA